LKTGKTVAVIGIGVVAVAFSVYGLTVVANSASMASNNQTPLAQAVGTPTGSESINTTSASSTNSSSALEVPAPGNAKNEYYIFTQELNANEDKLGIPVAVYSVTTLIAHKGDNVTIHFINPAEEAEDRHTFTMQAPYKMDVDLAGGQNQTFSFVANTTGGFTYYCRYDLPSMTGHLEVLP
jgi:plastocyanin